MIAFDGVSKIYGKRTILDNVDLSIRAGEFVSIVGNSGSGKTTIIKLILGIEQPSEGTVFVEGRALSGLGTHEVQYMRRMTGCVFQDAKLLADKTVFENIAYPLELTGYSLHQISEMVPSALSEIGIVHIQDQYPHQISGGEAQRVALARAIVHHPRLLLADEPTGHLDYENAKIVIKQLVKLNLQGMTVVLTTHNKPLVELVGQRVLHLENALLRNS